MPFQRPWLLIGVSARIYYPAGPVLDLGGVWTKTLHYLEQSVAHWVMRGGALPVMVPAVDADSIVKRSEIELAHYAEALDGLVLQGGNDLAPRELWRNADAPRLARRPRARPLRDGAGRRLHQGRQAGVRHLPRLPAAERDASAARCCRTSPRSGPTRWRTATRARFERHFHEIELVRGSRLAQLYPDVRAARW